jgi:hypothetical protein
MNNNPTSALIFFSIFPFLGLGGSSIRQTSKPPQLAGQQIRAGRTASIIVDVSLSSQT